MIAKQDVGIRQAKAELLGFRVDGTGTASILEGKYHATLTDNDVGDYTLTFARPHARTPVVVGVVPLTVDTCFHVESVSETAVNVKFAAVDETEAAADADFHITLLCFFSDTER